MDSKLQTIVNNSPLADFEKVELVEALVPMPGEYLEELCVACEAQPWLVSYLYVNLAAKKYAVSKKDSTALKTIVENEARLLEHIL